VIVIHSGTLAIQIYYEYYIIITRDVEKEELIQRVNSFILTGVNKNLILTVFSAEIFVDMMIHSSTNISILVRLQELLSPCV
jgi:hypothetical protein